jgi:hypothetical protein
VVLDDLLNQQLGRVTAYQAFSCSQFEQLGNLLRYGPDAVSESARPLPDIGEHSRNLLSELASSRARSTCCCAQRSCGSFSRVLKNSAG